MDKEKKESPKQEDTIDGRHPMRRKWHEKLSKAKLPIEALYAMLRIDKDGNLVDLEPQDPEEIYSEVPPSSVLQFIANHKKGVIITAAVGASVIAITAGAVIEGPKIIESLQAKKIKKISNNSVFVRS